MIGPWADPNPNPYFKIRDEFGPKFSGPRPIWAGQAQPRLVGAWAGPGPNPSLKTTSKTKTCFKKEYLFSIVVAFLALAFVGSIVAAVTYNILVVETRADRLRQHEQEEKLLHRQLVKQIYAKIQSWDDDGLEVNSFAQEILRLIGKLKKNRVYVKFLYKK